MKKHIYTLRTTAAKDKSLPDAAYRVLAIILNSKDEKALGDPFYATHKDVGDWLGGKSRRAVQNSLSALVRCGYLEKLEMVGCPPRRLYRIGREYRPDTA